MNIPPLKWLAVACCFALPGLAPQAAISLDRTRVIFDGENKSVSLNIRNDNSELPYLAQSWIENDQQQKVTAPIIVLPPLQRVEPSTGGQVKLLKTPEAEQLPKDRESLFYFNLREVPPSSETSNTMQIALQTKIKLFYRPQEIAPDKNVVWQERLIVSKVPGGFQVENPTPYFITLNDLQDVSDKRSESNFEPVMLAPFSSKKLEPESHNVKQPVITYINDYGGYHKLSYHCEQTRCSLKQGS
ncbi:molecular chaperone [Pseudomonas fluorescens]|uniref:fimbrial biogenesis chaperone n=1 Tax=Pseudomonas fluorescens TaxID=294 RepID=UPI00069C85BB|nr:fimbria/pilus periplasmic chaperone [Pseudomonas fluorescens]